MESSGTVEVVRRLAAPAERVHDAWLDPGIVGRRLFATPTGEMTKVEIDPRVGGEFQIVERRGGEEFSHEGVYTELDRPHRLAFDFAVIHPDLPAISSHVAVAIAPEGEACELKLTHTGVLPEYVDRTREGWGKVLDSLASVLG